MKRILVVVFFLIAIIALTGIVSAQRNQNIEITADVIPASLGITCTGGISNWTLNQGDNTIGDVVCDVSNNGYTGYQVSVKDDPSSYSYNPDCMVMEKLMAGHMSPYSAANDCWDIGNIVLFNPLHILDDVSTPTTEVVLSGSNQLLNSGTVSAQYHPGFKQTITTSDQRGADALCDDITAQSCDYYMIIVTFTVTPT